MKSIEQFATIIGGPRHGDVVAVSKELRVVFVREHPADAQVSPGLDPGLLELREIEALTGTSCHCDPGEHLNELPPVAYSVRQFKFNGQTYVFAVQHDLGIKAACRAAYDLVMSGDATKQS